METLADRLRQEIDYLGLTRKELASRARIKQRALDMYLGTQASMPPADVAVRLATALNVTVEYLVTGKAAQETAKEPRLRNSLAAMLKDFSKCSKETQVFFSIAIKLFSKYESK